MDLNINTLNLTNGTITSLCVNGINFSSGTSNLNLINLEEVFQ